MTQSIPLPDLGNFPPPPTLRLPEASEFCQTYRSFFVTVVRISAEELTSSVAEAEFIMFSYFSVDSRNSFSCIVSGKGFLI